MVFRYSGIELDRLEDAINCCFVPADLMSDHAEEVKGVRMVGLILQNLPIEGFRLLQAAGPVVLEGEIQGFRDGRHRHF